MTTTDKRNLVQYPNLPDNLKAGAMTKAIDIGYTEQEATRLWFNVQGNQLAKGVIDKGILSRAAGPFKVK